MARAVIDTLYSFRRCPYAMRARMSLLVGRVPFEIREVVLRAKPAELIALSPKATVPVLHVAGGGVIDQSLDIMRWALVRSDPEDWLGGDDPELIAVFDDAFKHQLDRYKYAERHNADPVTAREAGVALLAERLEPRLAGARHLCGAARGLADIAIFPFVRQFAAVAPEWFAAQPIAQVHGWLAGCLAMPVFERAMAPLRPWSPGDAPIVW